VVGQAVDAFNNAASAAVRLEPDAAVAAGISDSKASSPSPLLQRDAAAVTRSQRLGLLILLFPSSSTLSSACDEAAGRGGLGRRHRESALALAIARTAGRRNRQLRFHGGLPRLRHRTDKIAIAIAAAPAPSDRHR